MDIRRLRFFPALNWVLVMLGLWVQIAIHFTSGLFISGLMKSFSLGSYQVSILIGSGFIVHAVMQLFSGYLVGRFGPRCVQSVGALVCALGALGLSQATCFEWALVFRIIMCSGFASSFVSIGFMSANWFPARHYTLLLSLSEFIGFSSAFIAEVAFTEALERVEWRVIISFIGWVALLLGGLVLMCVRDSKESSEKIKAIDFKSYLFQLKRAAGRTIVWRNSLCSGALFLTSTAFCGVWAPKYFSLLYRDDLIAAKLCSTLILGIMVGCPLVGAWADRCVKQSRLMIGLGIGCLLMMVWTILFPIFPSMPVYIAYDVMFCLGFFSTGWVIAFGICFRFSGHGERSTMQGFTNFVCFGLGPIVQIIIGGLLNSVGYWRHALHPNQYDLSDYQWSLAIIPMIMVIMLILMNQINWDEHRVNEIS